jgi:hypothetical protein
MSAINIRTGCAVILAGLVLGAVGRTAAAESYPDRSKDGLVYAVEVPAALLERVLLHSGMIDRRHDGAIVIEEAQLVLRNRELGRTATTGTIRIEEDDRILFMAASELRFAPDSPGTSLGFGTIRPDDDGDTIFVVYTGRWIKFFGVRWCPGQVFEIPGEAQCI